MMAQQNAQHHTGKRGRFSDEPAEKALHDEQNHHADNDNIQQIHKPFLSKPQMSRQDQYLQGTKERPLCFVLAGLFITPFLPCRSRRRSALGSGEGFGWEKEKVDQNAFLWHESNKDEEDAKWKIRQKPWSWPLL
jgi:hypothetical protein